MALNKYHRNIKFTSELNPTKFLDTKIKTDDNNNITTEVYKKPNSLPAHWSSKIPKRYKRNTINTELYRAKRISTNLEQEIENIETKYEKAAYPKRFIQSVVNEFKKKEESTNEDDMIIPKWLFDERIFLPIKIPFCGKNEYYAKRFLERLNYFTNEAYKPLIIWQTRKIRSLFSVKDKIIHTSNVIYEGTCTCLKKYIGETDRNNSTRWNEHNDPNHKSDPAKHIKDNIEHHFQWKILRITNYKTRKRRILEALYIAKFQPKINNQLEMHKLQLFKYGFID